MIRILFASGFRRIGTPQWLLCGAAGLLLWCAASPVRALDPERPLTQALLRIWQAPQGLPRAAILAIHQSRDGYLWLGTQAGLYRFDGVRFVAMASGAERLLANQWIQDIAEDADGRLWLATDEAGLLCLQDGTATRVPLKGLSQRIQCLHVDRRGDLWVGSDAGLARVQNGEITIYGVSDQFPSDDVRAFAEAADGAIWIATAGPHLCRWDESGFHAVEAESLPSHASINHLLCGADGKLWIGSTAGLIRMVGADEHLFTADDGLASDIVHFLAPEKHGGLWVGTKDGFCRILGDRIECFQTHEGLSQSTVFALCEDHEGSLWVGTKHGLNQLVDRRVLLPFTTNEGLPSNDTGPLVQDQAGNVWVGTLSAGLSQFEGRGFETRAKTEEGLPSNRILSLAADAKGALWIGTAKGLACWREGKLAAQYTTEQGLPSDTVLSLCQDHDGRLWIGTAAGLATFDDGRIAAIEGDDAALGRAVQAIVEHGNQEIVASLAGIGLYHVTGSRLEPWSTGLQITSNVTAFHVDDQQRLWVALQAQGVGLITAEGSFQFGVKDGLYDDDIFGITSDDKGQLWMACSRGIFAVSLSELEAFAKGKLEQLTCTPFSPTDALRTIECQHGVQPGIYKMQDGRIWFSTIRGVIVIDPDRSARILPPPSVVIEEAQVNGRDVSPAAIHDLAPGESNLHFHYTALSFTSPTRVNFRYRLEGFDSDWVNAGARREAFYTNLRPGKYRFRVQATNTEGDWSEAKRPIAFTLRPHFYESRWFVPVLAVAVAGIAGLVYRLRIEQVKSRLQAVLAERSRIARELHDTLLQGFSGVTMQLQALSARLGGSPELETLREIIRDAGGCLRDARRSVAGLRNPSEREAGLSAALAQAARQLTESADVRLRLHLEPIAVRIHPDVVYNLVRIVQEAIANSLKHAGAGNIEVTAKSGREAIEITVQDDGVGFDASDHLEHVRPGHYGLIGMRERAAQIGAELRWREGPRHGAAVTIYLPFAHAARAPSKLQEPSAPGVS